MNFNEFVSEVKDNIKLFLPEEYENVEVSTMECQQLNRAYTGLMVRKEGEMLTPTINLNQLYEAYKAQPGVTMETVCRKIADIVIEAPIQVDLKSILNYEDVKDKLFIRVSSAEANKEVLENAPHQLKEDLAITYHVAVDKDENGLSSMFIKNDLLEQAGAQRIEPYLLSEGIGCLDYVFVTHGDEDHISGIRELLEGQKLGVRIDTLVLPPEEYHDEKLADLARIAVENGTRVVSVKTGANIYGRGERQTEKNDSKEVMRLRCIGPLTDIPQGLTKPKAGNEASLVLEFSYGNFDMLFTGDVEGAGEELLVKSDVLRKYEILKCAHHGSKNSGTAAFLEKTDPRAAIISAGIDNRYGHPHEETLNRLKKRKVKTYNTQTDGAVTIKSDGIQISIESFLLSK